MIMLMSSFFLNINLSSAIRYGTFLFDNEQERAKAGASIKTASLWSMVNIPDERKRLSNPVYQPSEQGWIRPSFKPESIQIWFAFFGKGTPYVVDDDDDSSTSFCC